MSEENTASATSDRLEDTLDPDDWEAFREVSHDILDELLTYVRDVRERPVWRPIPAGVKRRVGRSPLPQAPRPVEDVWEELDEVLLPYTAGNIHPRFWGWVHGSGTPVGILAEMAAAAVNANLGGREHVPVYIERRVIEWFRDLFGFPEEAGGVLVSGTSMGTLIALATARNAAGPVRKAGLAELGEQFVVYTSEEVHVSARKAAELLGLGRAGVRSVPTDPAFRMDPTALEAMIREDRAAGLRPLCVIGTAGTVNTGAIDDLEALADVCGTHGLWFHVDGAFGALLALSEALRPRLAGIEQADSVAFDFHKWMHVPYSAGCVLVRDGELQRRAFAARPDYLRTDERALSAGAPWFTDLGPELSRGFLGLKVWFTLQAYGTRRLGAMIEKNVEQARLLAERVSASSRLELAAPAPLNVVCFRYTHPELDDAGLDAANREIVHRLQETGVAAPSTTRIRGRTVIRAALTNHRTRTDDLDRFVSAVESIGDAVAREAVAEPDAPLVEV